MENKECLADRESVNDSEEGESSRECDEHGRLVQVRYLVNSKNNDDEEHNIEYTKSVCKPPLELSFLDVNFI